MKRNFHYCFCILFVLERLLNARLDPIIHQNKTQFCSVELQVSDKADGQTGLCTQIYILYLWVSDLGSSVLVGAGVTQGPPWLTHWISQLPGAERYLACAS